MHQNWQHLLGQVGHIRLVWCANTQPSWSLCDIRALGIILCQISGKHTQRLFLLWTEALGLLLTIVSLELWPRGLAATSSKVAGCRFTTWPHCLHSMTLTSSWPQLDLSVTSGCSTVTCSLAILECDQHAQFGRCEYFTFSLWSRCVLFTKKMISSRAGHSAWRHAA